MEIRRIFYSRASYRNVGTVDEDSFLQGSVSNVTIINDRRRHDSLYKCSTTVVLTEY